ncbi:MAG: GNAT family N-acetyltransferase [Ottowia sp.]|nr:GNAT family N-acetyltransferase [Ottowia sp.]
MKDPPAPVAALRWRCLQPTDLDGMEALHRASLAGFRPEAVKPETRDFLASLLQGRGRVLGAWRGDELVAYGVLQHVLSAEDRIQALLGLAPGAPLLKLAGAAVAPALRGQQLQRELIARRLAWADGRAVFATAAPCNPASWHNLLACGFSVRALQERYGGYARYLLARVPGEHFAGDPARGCELGPDALERQRELLAQGWRGVGAGGSGQLLCLQPPVASA